MDPSPLLALPRSHCQVDATRQLELRCLPPMLSFSLQRFVFDYAKMDRVKVSDKFAFPLTLDLAPIMCRVGGLCWAVPGAGAGAGAVLCCAVSSVCFARALPLESRCGWPGVKGCVRCTSWPAPLPVRPDSQPCL
jgi:hypothetical protein